MYANEGRVKRIHAPMNAGRPGLWAAIGDVEIGEIAGPHLLLQVQPGRAWGAIGAFLQKNGIALCPQRNP